MLLTKDLENIGTLRTCYDPILPQTTGNSKYFLTQNHGCCKVGGVTHVSPDASGVATCRSASGTHVSTRQPVSRDFATTLDTK
jgi:hypothetical protein